MAERLDVDRTTVYRDRTELETHIPFVEVEPGRWAIDRLKYLSSIRVNLAEALALYLVSVGKPPTGSKMHITVLR